MNIHDIIGKVFPQRDPDAELLSVVHAPRRLTDSPMKAKALFDSVPRYIIDQVANGMRPNGVMDAPFAINFVGNLAAYLEPELAYVPFEQTNFAQLVPVDTSANQFAPAVSFISVEGQGQASLLSASASDIPNAAAKMTLRERPVFMGGIGYEFNVEEINKALLYGADLSAAKMVAARQAANQYMMNWTLTGDAVAGVKGLINTTGPNTANVANDGTGSSRLWTAKTGDLVARDVQEAIRFVITASKDVFVPNTVLMSHERLSYLAQTRLGSQSDTTILEFLQRTYRAQYSRDILFAAHSSLATAGDSGTQRLVAYYRDPMALKLPLPMPHQFLPVWQAGPLEYQVPGIFRVAELQIRQPTAIVYRDGF